MAASELIKLAVIHDCEGWSTKDLCVSQRACRITSAAKLLALYIRTLR